MIINDLETLVEFFDQLTDRNPDIDYFLPLSNGEKAVDEISGYYTNDYAGTTAFFQVAESLRKGELITFLCSLTVAKKPADVGAKSSLNARNITHKIMMALLGQLDIAAEEAQDEIEEQGDMYDLLITPVDRVFPISMLANVNLEGWYVDIDVTVPANSLLYP